MASFCFSIFVEALQTLVHIDHQDEMHHPISVLCIGKHLLYEHINNCVTIYNNDHFTVIFSF